MSCPPALSRRRLLASAGVTTMTALAGCTRIYSTLPDRITYARTRRREIPTVPSPVFGTDAHLHDLADETAEYVDPGLEAWERVGEREHRVHYTQSRLERAAEFAAERDWESPTTETVQSGRAHLWNAAGSYAYATAQLDEFDRDPTAGAADSLEEAETRHQEFEYATGDPAIFLAYGRYVERELQQAHSLLSRRVDAEVEDRRERTSRAERIAELYSGVRQAQARIDSAVAYREALREHDPGSDPFGEAMADARAILHDRVDPLLESREEWSERIGEFDGDGIGESETGRRDVHDALYSRSSYGESAVSDANRRVDGGYDVYGTVELANGWLHLAAARAECERIESDGIDLLDSGAIDAAKRAAIDRLEGVLADDPGQLTLFFAAEARSWITAGDSGIERSSLDDAEEEWRWSQANGYARYLLAKGILERIDEAVAVVTDTGE
ncbi:hypothetical protein G6M89_14405 [Natronolimnobius sp. AArcel1]|uniref:hypothetical protein n=1 Tax=Natronolimnobius sp. AArcel1 TaxID=1679093 RepID=UPI0013EC82A9|nr:hypothetical protein [Natronolimnobius sp. AArcel1]NGM70186.1 hypothetical protein [Natronolimnobius sp. AArcel1]